MSPASNTLLSLIILALGIIGLILSFLVQDRKKSLISMVLASLILVTGLYQFGAQAYKQQQWNKRLSQLRAERPNLEELRKRLRSNASQPDASGTAKKK